MKKIDGLNEAYKIAKIKNGRCLSKKYINTRTPMLWKCLRCPCKWKARLNDIKRGKWCPKCAKTFKLSINDAHAIAKTKNGLCLSKYIKNGQEKIKWRCASKHIWHATLISIRHGSWCPYCSKRFLVDGLKESNMIAKNRGGVCLSNKYINSSTKMKWRCKNKHKWFASFGNVKIGTWCPECAQTKRALSSTNSYIIIHWKTKEKLVCQGGWEKAVVIYFNKNKINFKWQPRSFTMPNGRKYYPDCYLYSVKKWIEIKGYFRKDAKEKWDWFKTIKPNSELWDEKKLKKMKIIKR